MRIQVSSINAYIKWICKNYKIIQIFSFIFFLFWKYVCIYSFHLKRPFMLIYGRFIIILKKKE